MHIRDFEVMLEAINEDSEWLQTTEGDEIHCIGLENLDGIFKRFLSGETFIKAIEDAAATRNN